MFTRTALSTCTLLHVQPPVTYASCFPSSQGCFVYFLTGSFITFSQAASLFSHRWLQYFLTGSFSTFSQAASVMSLRPAAHKHNNSIRSGLFTKCPWYSRYPTNPPFSFEQSRPTFIIRSIAFTMHFKLFHKIISVNSKPINNTNP